jgi:hypothetical protein
LFLLLVFFAYFFFDGVEVLPLLFFDVFFVGFEVDFVGFDVGAVFFGGGFAGVRAFVDGDAVGFFVGAFFFGVGVPWVHVDFGVVGVVGDLAVAIV